MKELINVGTARNLSRPPSPPPPADPDPASEYYLYDRRLIDSCSRVPCHAPSIISAEHSTRLSHIISPQQRQHSSVSTRNIRHCPPQDARIDDCVPSFRQSNDSSPSVPRQDPPDQINSFGTSMGRAATTLIRIDPSGTSPLRSAPNSQCYIKHKVGNAETRYTRNDYPLHQDEDELYENYQDELFRLQQLQNDQQNNSLQYGQFNIGPLYEMGPLDKKKSKRPKQNSKRENIDDKSRWARGRKSRYDQIDRDDGRNDNHDETNDLLDEMPDCKTHPDFYSFQDDDEDIESEYDNEEERPLQQSHSTSDLRTKRPVIPLVLSRAETCLNRSLVVSFVLVILVLVRDQTPLWKNHQSQVALGKYEREKVLEPMQVYSSNDDDSSHARDYDPTHKYGKYTADKGLSEGPAKMRNGDDHQTFRFVPPPSPKIHHDIDDSDIGTAAGSSAASNPNESAFDSDELNDETPTTRQSHTWGISFQIDKTSDFEVGRFDNSSSTEHNETTSESFYFGESNSTHSISMDFEQPVASSNQKEHVKSGFDESMTTEDVKSVYKDTFFRWNHPFRHDRISDPNGGIDIPVFWRISRSASGILEAAMSYCYGLTLASAVGAGFEDETLKKIQVPAGAAYVNVDMSTPTGINHAADLKLGISGLVDVISTPFIYETASIFRDIPESGKCFTLLRHPVGRAVSLYHHYQDGDGVNPNSVHYQGLTIDEYADVVAENNWMVRFLTGKRSGLLSWQDLEAAKEIFGRKCLVGLSELAEESIQRYMRYFHWENRAQNSNHELCLQSILSKHDKRLGHPTYEGTDAWETLRKKNEYDVLLYEYAKHLYSQQSVLYENID